MRNFKTTTNCKVVVDYMDWYYTWEDIRETFDLDSLGGYIVLDGRRCALKDIRDLPINDEGLEYLIWRQTPMSYEPDKYDERDKKYLMSRYGHYEDEYEIRPFYISYYGTGEYRVQFCTGEEAQGLMMIKRDKGRKEMDESESQTKICFEHYVQGEFYYVQVYSPHKAYFEEGKLRDSHGGITYRDYEDGSILYFTEKEAIESLPDYAGEIIPNTESQTFDSFEIIAPEKSELG